MFQKYDKRSLKRRIELHSIHFHSVLIFELNIPTHKPIQMSDENDILYNIQQVAQFSQCVLIKMKIIISNVKFEKRIETCGLPKEITSFFLLKVIFFGYLYKICSKRLLFQLFFFLYK